MKHPIFKEIRFAFQPMADSLIYQAARLYKANYANYAKKGTICIVPLT